MRHHHQTHLLCPLRLPAQVDRMYLEGYLDDIVSVEFLLEVEDGSLEQVGGGRGSGWVQQLAT